MKLKKERLDERYAQRIFRSASFGPTKNASFCVIILKVEEGGMAVMWAVKIVVLLRLRSRRGNEDWEAAFVQYKEITSPSEAVEKNLGCICLRRLLLTKWETVFVVRSLQIER